MAKSEDPIIGQLVTEYAEMFTLFEEILGAVKDAGAKIKDESYDFTTAKVEFNKCLREGALLLASLKDAIELMHDTASREAAKAAEMTMRECKVAIWKLAAEAAREGFTFGAETAIEKALLKAFGGLKEEILEINELLSRIRGERRRTVHSEIGIRLASRAATFVLVFMFLAALFSGVWVWVGDSSAKAIALDGEKAREWDLAWQHLDELSRIKLTAAYQEGVRDLAEKATATANQAELDRTADEAHKRAEEAKAAADKAEAESILRANELQASQDQLKALKPVKENIEPSAPTTAGKK